MKSRISSVIANKGFQRQISQSQIASQKSINAWIRQEAPPAKRIIERPAAEGIPEMSGAFPSIGKSLLEKILGETLTEAPSKPITTPPPSLAVPPPPIQTPAPPELPEGKEEAVVLLEGRPSLLIRGDRIEIPRSGIWVQPLLSARALVEPWLRSVGRVEIDDGSGSRHGGTGWMIAKGIIATNRHVAEVFSANRGGQVTFLKNFTGTEYKARIDFLEEYQEPQQFEIPIEKVLFLQDRDPQKPDVALLKLVDDPNLPPPIPILSERLAPDAPIAVIGYPAYDSRYGVDSLEASKAVFGSIYDVKRLSPGQVMEVPENCWYFTHDATTLGGNSGSIVLDLKSGLAAGMHFLGEFREANYAVHASVVADIAEANRIKIIKKSAWVSLPTKVEEKLEKPNADTYINREGYSKTFIDQNVPISLPKPSDGLDVDLVKFGPNNNQTELKYTHFTVVMHSKRKMCIYSAVNIDGKKSVSVKGKRPQWRLDPRISDEAQILKDCYGRETEGKFSRGHMTRREDPNWGTAKIVEQSNFDTFHVTNACPQMQPFNAGIWNGLEDYALQNARQDDMHISVFTGPVFRDDDPELFEAKIKIPVTFWKVIAFIHDQTGKLTATGYTMSQRDFLPGEEFVFGQFGTYQTSIRDIEQMTNLSFGNLTECDPMKTIPEAPSLPIRPIRGYEEILLTGILI